MTGDRLSVGAVVTKTTTTAGRTYTDRGVIVETFHHLKPGDPVNSFLTIGPVTRSSIVVQASPGTYVVSDLRDRWKLVPPQMQTCEEAVQSVILRWEPPDWTDDPQDLDSMEWAGIEAVIRSIVYEYDLDGVSGTPELLIRLAQLVDELLGAEEAATKAYGLLCDAIGHLEAGRIND